MKIRVEPSREDITEVSSGLGIIEDFIYRFRWVFGGSKSNEKCDLCEARNETS